MENGLLIAEKLHVYRFDHPIGYDSPKKNIETIVIYKTLSRINSDTILNYHEPMSPWITTIIITLPIISVSIILIWKRNALFKINLKNQ